MLILLLLGEEVLMSRAGTGVQSGEELRSGAGFALSVRTSGSTEERI
jgi:hypothetical protein